MTWSPLLADPAWLLVLGLIMLVVPGGRVVAVGERHRVARRAATPRCDCEGCEGNPLTLAAKLSDRQALDRFRARLRAEDRAPDTVSTYAIAVGNWLAWLRRNRYRWDRATPAHLERYLHQPSDKRNPPPKDGSRRAGRPPGEYLTPASRVLYSTAVCRFYREMRRAKVLRSDRMADWIPLRRGRSKPRTIGRASVRQVIAAAAGADRRLWAMLWTKYRAALRAVEVARAEVGDVDLTNQTMDVRGKGGRGEVTRTIPLHPELVEVLDGWMAELAASGPLFPARGPRPGGHLKATTVVKIFNRVLAPYGETSHVLRHLMTQETQVAGGDVDATAGLTGHADLKTLRIYTGGANAHTVAAVNKVPRLAEEFHVVGAPGRILGAHHAGERIPSSTGPRLHQRGGGPDDRTP